MAINPELITTIRVDQLPDGTLNLTNKIPHTSGTVLEKASVQELVDLVATAIGVSGGVGYIAISVTDGQQLPDVPELPSFFLCGAGTFLNINGYPNIICTENLNAIMSLTDHWELAVEIPINPLSGTVQSVTGSAVDNTDPLNPVINEIISGVQNIVAGTNITVDNTDPANPIVSATGGAGTPTLQDVLDNNHDLVDGLNFQGSSAGDNNTGIFVNAFGQDAANANTGTLVNALGTEAAIENTGSNVNAFGNVAAGFNTGNNVNALGDNAGYENVASNVNAIGAGAARSNSGDQVNAFGVDSCFENTGGLVNAFGTEAGYQNAGNNSNFLGEQAGSLNTGESVNAMGASALFENSGNSANAFGDSALAKNTGHNANAFGEKAGYNPITNLGNTFKNVNLFGFRALADADNQTVFSKWISGVTKYLGRLSFNNITADRKWELPDADGTLALTSDITTPTLQEVTDEGNETTDEIIINNWKSKNYDNILGVYEELSTNKTATLKTQEGITNLSEWEIKPYSGVFAFESDIPTIQAGTNITIDDTDPLNPIINASGGSSGIPHATASGTDTYTATVTGVTAYNDADAYLIRFTNGNTTGATLNINSLGAIPLYKNNDGVLIGGDIIDGGEMLCIYNSTNNNFQVIGTAPNSLFSYVTNDDSVTLTKGMPVYAFSGTGDRMTVKRANNTGDATSAQTVGLVLSTSIAAGQKGLIMMQGLLDGLSILPTATFADGDAVYLGATDGSITNVKPYAPNHLVYLGVVTTASNGSAGRMYVRVQNGYELSEIHDIDLISNAPTNNQVLTYETSTDLWKNKTIIQDSITDGVTTIAPSQNAVFDALALKQNSLSYTPYRNIQTSQTVHTGTTAETVVFTATIPAGTFNSTDIIRVLFGTNKTTALGTYNLRVRVNTTNTIATAPTIAIYAGSATAQTVIIQRNYNLNGGNLYGFAFSTSALTDIFASGAGLSSTTLNPANQFFIFGTVLLANAGDSIIGNMFSIHN